jgi:hypothetical protein
MCELNSYMNIIFKIILLRYRSLKTYSSEYQRLFQELNTVMIRKAALHLTEPFNMGTNGSLPSKWLFG